jgi:hypothetical protein
MVKVVPAMRATDDGQSVPLQREEVGQKGMSDAQVL